MEAVEEWGLESEAVSYGKSNPKWNLTKNGATDDEIAFLLDWENSTYSNYVGRRVELNAFASGDLITWIEEGLRHHGIKKLVPDTTLNGHPENRLPNTLNMILPELRGESIVIALDQHGISISSGSACKSGSPEPTHVLIAMGRTEQEAHCSVRLSLSRYTTEGEINKTVSALAEVLEEKNTVRLMPCK